MKNLDQQIKESSLQALQEEYPFLPSYFENTGLTIPIDEPKTLLQFLNGFDEEDLEDLAIKVDEYVNALKTYLEQMFAFLGNDDKKRVDTVDIFPGHDKSGRPEQFEKLSIKRGDVISIVGPTGSGKSRLLADIEWMAQNDTPTGRSILINGDKPDSKWRYSVADKLVAQLSQNMNFVMDLTVEEFIRLHCDSRMINDPDTIVEKILNQANDLAGEPFANDTAITALSGGQSRALMIADTAILSHSPIVLIDEIENAGIDRKKALKLLLEEDKIVLMATHDPVLALMGDYRIVIKNGGIHKIIETKESEIALLSKIEELDNKVQQMRSMLRAGDTLETFEF